MLAAAAHAGTISQTLNYDLAFDASPILTFQGFDDQGGTLQLDRVIFDWDLNYEIIYRLENTGPTAIAPGDFYLAVEYYNVHQLGIGEAPAYGPGGTYMAIDNVGLGAYDPQPGGSDTYPGTFTDSYQRTLEFTAAEYPETVGALNQPGPIETLYGGFGGLMFWWINEPEGWDVPEDEPVYPTDHAVWFFSESMRHFGTVTLTYVYSPVPEPSMAGLLAIALVALVYRPLRGNQARK
jgi:hypothetical protein